MGDNLGMEPVAILYPAFAMAFLTLAVFYRVGVARYLAVNRRDVRAKYYRLYEEQYAERPDRLRVLERHLQNHFEVPPLFYAAVIIAFVTAQVTTLQVTLAWLFVAGRVVHTAIHLSYNKVLHRFLMFGATLMVLTALWISILVGLLDTV